MKRRSGGKILVGTASWADPGFIETWYPKGLPASERLPWYAEHFNLVELNSSFYAIPEVRMVERWCRQTPTGFVFDVKLHRLLSRHSTQLNMLPPDLRHLAKANKGKAVLTPALEKAVAQRFLESIEPFSKSGRMGSLLLQLSPSFGPRRHDLTELEDLFDWLRPHRIAIELRNADWVSAARLATTEEFFRKRRLTFVCVDAPAESHFMILPGIDLVTNTQFAYLRLHGRNSEGYIRGRSVAERFNYIYKPSELEAIAERAAKLAEAANELHVVYNNNMANYAPVNAGQFRKILDEKFPDLSTGPEQKAPRSQEKELQLELAGDGFRHK